MDTIVFSMIEAVVPFLNIVTGCNGQHVDGPAERRSHCIVLVTHLSAMYSTSSKREVVVALTELLEYGRDISLRLKGQCHQLSDIVVCAAVRAVSWLQS